MAPYAADRQKAGVCFKAAAPIHKWAVCRSTMLVQRADLTR